MDLIEQLAPDQAADIIDELPSDSQADLIADLADHRAEAILAHMDPEEAANARQLLQYDDDVAYGLMVTEYLAYPLEATVKDVIDDFADRGDDTGTTIFSTRTSSTSRAGQGVLRIRDLADGARSTPVKEIMIKDPVYVHDDMELDDLEDFFDQHRFLGVPVVDENERLIGIVQRSASRKRGGAPRDDYLKAQGIVGGEEFRRCRCGFARRAALSWLSINILLNVLAASVIAI